MILKGKYVLLLTWLCLEVLFCHFRFLQALSHLYFLADRPTTVLWLRLHLHSVPIFTLDYTLGQSTALCLVS